MHLINLPKLGQMIEHDKDTPGAVVKGIPSQSDVARIGGTGNDHHLLVDLPEPAQ